MIIYVEKDLQGNAFLDKVLSLYSAASVVEIDHYKNLFDKSIHYPLEKCLIFAKSDRLKIYPVPENYGYPDAKSFFFVTQLNCIFDCSYCYLQGTFKNKFPVIFFNYDDIQVQLALKISELRNQGYSGKIVFYASNYSDLLAMEHMSFFHQSFIPFFEQFDNVLMETRTKSANTQFLLDLNMVPHNTEIAFSLNPQEIIDTFEKGASPLKKRIAALKQLQLAGFKVGLRFLPLLPVENYETIYDNFLREFCQEIDISNVNSIFLATLIYNKQDRLILQKKQSDFDLLSSLEMGEDGLVRVRGSDREIFDGLFRKYFGKRVFWDYI